MGTKLTPDEQRTIADAIERQMCLYVGGDTIEEQLIETSYCAMQVKASHDSLIINCVKQSMAGRIARMEGHVAKLFGLHYCDIDIGDHVGIRMYPDSTVVIAYSTGLATPNNIIDIHTYCNYSEQEFAKIIPDMLRLIDKHIIPSRPVLMLRRFQSWIKTCRQH